MEGGKRGGWRKIPHSTGRVLLSALKTPFGPRGRNPTPRFADAICGRMISRNGRSEKYAACRRMFPKPHKKGWFLFTCGEAAGPRKARVVVVVVVVGGPNRVSCVSYSPSLQILFGVGSDPPAYSTKLCHYKFTSGWDPPLSNNISLRGGIQCKYI